MSASSYALFQKMTGSSPTRSAGAAFIGVATAAILAVAWFTVTNTNLPPRDRSWFGMMIAVSIAANVGYFVTLRRGRHGGQVHSETIKATDALGWQRRDSERTAKSLVRLVAGCKEVVCQIGALVANTDRLDQHLEELVSALSQPHADSHETPIRAQIGQISKSTSHDALTKDKQFGRRHLRDTLKAAWTRYQEGGDGHFNIGGWKGELRRSGMAVEVLDLGEREGAVLAIVDPNAEDNSFFVVPDFTKSPGAVSRWFDDQSSGRLGGRIDELRALGRGKPVEGRIEVLEKGVVA